MHERQRVQSEAPLTVLPALSQGVGTQPITASYSEAGRPLLLCLTHLRWDFVWQRPQHLLTRAARDFTVVVVEEPIWRPVDAPHLDITHRPAAGRPDGIRVMVPVMPDGTDGPATIHAQRDLLQAFLAQEGQRVGVLWYYTPMAIAFSQGIAADIVLYDNMDELSAFNGASPEMLAYEEALFARADLVFTGGLSLWEAKRGRHPRVTAFASSIDVDHFGRARSRPAEDPHDQAGIPTPRIGFFGVIDERADLGLVTQVAALRPDWQLVMIGPVVKIDPETLPQADNIHWLGPKSYGELPDYLAGWQLGFMPFALNEATRFISPTKTPEFLAAGLPLVSTRIRDVVRPYGDRGLVEIADDAGEVVRRCEMLLSRPREAWLAAVDRHLSAGSWDKTWAAMLDTIMRAGPVADPRPDRDGAPVGAAVAAQ